MRKRTLTVLLGLMILFTSSMAMAVNFNYKVYNPRQNKAYTAVLGTIRLTENQYIWGFYTKNGQPLCVASLDTNTKNGLVGGQCTDISAFMRFMNGEKIDINNSRYTLGWRELNTNTLYKEMDSIRRERASQGMYEYQVN